MEDGGTEGLWYHHTVSQHDDIVHNVEAELVLGVGFNVGREVPGIIRETGPDDLHELLHILVLLRGHPDLLPGDHVVGGGHGCGTHTTAERVLVSQVGDVVLHGCAL